MKNWQRANVRGQAVAKPSKIYEERHYCRPRRKTVRISFDDEASMMLVTYDRLIPRVPCTRGRCERPLMGSFSRHGTRAETKGWSELVGWHSIVAPCPAEATNSFLECLKRNRLGKINPVRGYIVRQNVRRGRTIHANNLKSTLVP